MKRILFLLSMIISIVSCSETEFDNRESVSYVFHAREFNYMWAFNISKTETKMYDLPYIKCEYVNDQQSVSVQDYALEFTTCNVDLDMIILDGLNYKSLYESGHKDILFYTPVYQVLSHSENTMQDASDKVIETKLLAYFEKRTSNNATRAEYADIAHIDYRTTPIKDINITASADINDKKAGESLNDLFLVDGYEQNHEFIITSNKDLVTDSEKITNITIDKYLFYRPMAPAALVFKFFDEFDIETPVTTTFTIEITTLDGKILTSETPLVTLTKK